MTDIYESLMHHIMEVRGGNSLNHVDSLQLSRHSNYYSYNGWSCTTYSSSLIPVHTYRRKYTPAKPLRSYIETLKDQSKSRLLPRRLRYSVPYIWIPRTSTTDKESKVKGSEGQDQYHYQTSHYTVRVTKSPTLALL